MVCVVLVLIEQDIKCGARYDNFNTTVLIIQQRLSIDHLSGVGIDKCLRGIYCNKSD